MTIDSVKLYHTVFDCFPNRGSAVSIYTKFAYFARIGVLCCGLTMTLAGCTSTKFGFPYKVGVQQGNWITKDQVAMIKPGMTREQVKFALGSPALTDVFHANRWDYPYFYRSGNGNIEERKFTVFFVDGKLDKWVGDEQPELQPYQIVKDEVTKSEREDKQIKLDDDQTKAAGLEPSKTLAPGIQIDGVLTDNQAEPASSTDTGVTGTQPMR
ncbi:Beta-barrel assembly machine subunit BamE [Jezberella montanilacus]|jgi:outer membrane protein assembly factor BamE|uniref:Outer membrane protein assembly factor BamE n=1 Tax=Jezberella montanilacus TaxID=323426 RepID=A0A2T0XB41_9BURK|nr:Beta-barrel assembly machine subunit BamE [Jezberella montanilacus]|eukprot:gene11376-11465_t